MLDDVVVVVEAKSSYVNRLVEGPGVWYVFLGQHFSDEARAETQLILPLLRHRPSRLQTASQVMLRVRLQRFFFGLLRRTTALSARPSLGRDRRWFTELVVGRGCGGVCFPLLALPLLLVRHRSEVRKWQQINLWSLTRRQQLSRVFMLSKTLQGYQI